MLGSVTGWSDADIAQWSRTKAASVGRTRPGVKLRIVDPDDGAPLGVDETGRVEVWRADFAGDHWMSTNDLGRIDADGFLYISGRTDDVIIRGGLKVSPGEVEERLAALPGVSEAAVVGVPDERLGEVPVAAVVRSRDAPRVPEEQLLAALRERLPAYKLPVRIVEIDALPRNAMLKVERRKLKEQLAALRK
jgi:acyl-CoA synthetase (AMP-forming)/AMP-acid ligase II